MTSGLFIHTHSFANDTLCHHLVSFLISTLMWFPLRHRNASDISVLAEPRTPAITTHTDHIKHLLRMDAITGLQWPQTSPHVAIQQLQAVRRKWRVGSLLKTSKPAHVDREGPAWVSPFTLKSQPRHTSPCTAQSSGGSWRLIWGHFVRGRSSQMESSPWRERPQCGGRQYHHPSMQRSRADKTNWFPAGALSGLQGGKWLLPADVCIKPVITKAPSLPTVLQIQWNLLHTREFCGYLSKIMMTSSKIHQRKWKKYRSIE